MTRRPATGGDLLRLVRVEGVGTRAELGRVTGLSRPAVAARVAALLAAGLLTERADGPSTGGRPPARLEFDASGGTVLVANLGHSRGQLAVCDLAGRVVISSDADLPPGASPAEALPRLLDGWDDLLAKLDAPLVPVRGAGLGVPDAMEAGRWAGSDPSPAVAARFGVPAFLDNEVNAAALGEHHAGAARGAGDVLFVKLSTGIGAGLIMGGRIQRGAFGAAGEIGHIAVAGGGGTPCRCGAADCLEAVAGGAALLARSPAADLAALSALARAGDPDAVALVREAGGRIGTVIAGAVNLLNPELVVLGGDLTGAYEPLVAGVRAEVYRRATAPATSRLRIEPSALGDAAGLIGCAAMVLDRILAPDAVDAAL
ncbi:N-acetylglucosamine repressor [Actinomadura rubteroloni]|uniref:N-acetylglucosamine repressor n=1 Tax=Actinomadura rubteroloni TaxID=1926885 RepID=A0A2P4UCZ1_9ACTN|nr:ROK family protein [Actinomadura rubteroloni]POM22910.1 N-acetylglucosamine repressor [Actinomadura rubteroloni]